MYDIMILYLFLDLIPKCFFFFLLLVIIIFYSNLQIIFVENGSGVYGSGLLTGSSDSKPQHTAKLPLLAP